MQRTSYAPSPLLVSSLYRNRWLLYELVSRDLRLRYRGSALGFAWTLLNPLIFMAVYTVVFGWYLKVDLPHYPVYLLSGLMAWNWFVGSLQNGTSAIVDGRMYVGKTVFPAELLVVVPVLSNLVNYLLSVPVLLVAVLLFHQHVGLPLLALPLVMITQALFTLGILFFVATANVFFRDLQQLVIYAVTIFFYLIPIFYPAHDIPAVARSLVLANPLAMIVMGYQDIFYYNTLPNLANIGGVFILAVVILALGYATFLRYKDIMGEYV